MRIFFDILLVSALFVAPFVFVCILAFIGLIYFSRYIEFVFIALVAELTYRGGDIHLLGIMLPMTIIALLCFFLAEFLKAFIHTRMI